MQVKSQANPIGPRWGFLLLTALLMTGCLQTREGKKEQEEKQVLKKQLSNLQMTTADANSRFQDLEDENRRLLGRIEALEARLQQTSAKAEKTGSAWEAKLREKDQAYVEEFAKVNAELKALRDALNDQRDDLKRIAQTRMDSATTEAAPKKASDAAKNPYKVAEEFFAKKQWREAAISYEKYRSQNPKGKSFSSATYKLGVCFQEMGMSDEAAAFYDEVISRFPGSKDATKAANRLKKLKGKK